MGKQAFVLCAKSKLSMLAFIIPVLLLSSGCQNIPSASPTAFTPAKVSATSSPLPTITVTVSTPTAERARDSSEILSKEKLDCAPAGGFTKCADEVLNLEFEHPITWGDIEAVLRTGGDSGYAYNYFFSGASIPETYPLKAAGVSVDFGEGRDSTPMDFAGFGDARLQTSSCERQDLYPICNEAGPDVRWMIRFPNARYFCEYTHQDTSPIFRIEINLSDHPRINGFVFEIPFLSENLSQEIKEDIYPGFLVEAVMPSPENCKPVNRQAFDERVTKFIERLEAGSLDAETLKNMDDLMHLAESITLDK